MTPHVVERTYEVLVKESGRWLIETSEWSSLLLSPHISIDSLDS